jgi:Uma2 family endonuclease
MDVGIRTPRSGHWDTSRIPDVVIIPKKQWQSLQARESIIELDEPPPLLVIEVVRSPLKVLTTEPNAPNTACATSLNTGLLIPSMQK